jgi:hypothetical protein
MEKTVNKKTSRQVDKGEKTCLLVHLSTKKLL